MYGQSPNFGLVHEEFRLAPSKYPWALMQTSASGNTLVGLVHTALLAGILNLACWLRTGWLLQVQLSSCHSQLLNFSHLLQPCCICCAQHLPARELKERHIKGMQWLCIAEPFTFQGRTFVTDSAAHLLVHRIPMPEKQKQTSQVWSWQHRTGLVPCDTSSLKQRV